MVDESNVMTVRLDAPETGGNGIRYSAYSSQGGRESQQDSLFVGEKEDALLAAVCDGMGGMNGGERAGETAIRLLTEAFFGSSPESIPQFFRETALRMDEAVYSLEQDGKRLGAGTTVVSVIVKEEGIYWLSVGDSRIYLFRKGELLCPVPAHNYRLLLDQMLQEGRITEEKYKSEEGKAEALISFLGLGGITRMEINRNPFLPEHGDQILLCSDGLYKSLSDRRILEVLSMSMSPEVKARTLVNSALEAGGKNQDNTSVILIEIS